MTLANLISGNYPILKIPFTVELSQIAFYFWVISNLRTPYTLISKAFYNHKLEENLLKFFHVIFLFLAFSYLMANCEAAQENPIAFLSFINVSMGVVMVISCLKLFNFKLKFYWQKQEEPNPFGNWTSLIFLTLFMNSVIQNELQYSFHYNN